MDQKLSTGTTTLGLVCTDGVVMGTEMRATMGHLISHKETQKLFMIDRHLGMTVAGLVGDAQALARWLSAEAALYNTRRGVPVTVQGASTVLANIMHGYRYSPFWVQLLVGGVDQAGPHVYSLDAAGGSIADKYVSTGSGSPFAYGVLEDTYRDEVTTEQGADLAIRAISAAMKRDSASGDGIALCTINKADGFRHMPKEEIDRRRKKLKIT